MTDQKEPDIRITIPKHLERELRLYRRLWLAQQDLLEAKAAMDEILKARTPFPRNNLPPPLLQSLTTALNSCLRKTLGTITGRVRSG